MAGVWDFDIGLFLSQGAVQKEGSLRLERLVRENGDDRDVYRIRDSSTQFICSSRTAGIIESHRRLGVPLFEWSNERFTRVKLAGHLPLEMARALVERASCASGPLEPTGGRWSYAYAADFDAAKRIERTLRAAVRLEGVAPRQTVLDRLLEGRRRGRPLNWYEMMKSENPN